MNAFAVGRIDFVNTVPVYLGIDSGRVDCPGRTVPAPPAALNRMLAEGKVQISAVSAAAYAYAFPRWLLLSDLSISARGPVRSVLLCLKRPLERGARIAAGLTDKSATAKALTRILLEDRHGCRPTYQECDLSEEFPEDLDALLVIGDDALKPRRSDAYPLTLDLGAVWMEWTGLPFVFGLWAVDRSFAAEYPEETARVAGALRRSRDLGLRSLQEAARIAAARTGVDATLCREYLEHIEYGLGEDHRLSLDRFYGLLKKRGEIDEAVRPLFFETPREAGVGE